MHKVVPIQQKKNNRLPNERDLPPSKQSEFYNRLRDESSRGGLLKLLKKDGARLSTLRTTKSNHARDSSNDERVTFPFDEERDRSENLHRENTTIGGASETVGGKSKHRAMVSSFLASFASAVICTTLEYFCHFAFAAVIFSHEKMQGFIYLGFVANLVGYVLSNMVYGALGTFNFAVSSVPSFDVPVLAGAMVTVANSVTLEEQLWPTAFVVIMGSTVVLGIMFMLLGRLKLLAWTNFIPTPVIQGFLAGNGIALLKSAFVICTGNNWNLLETNDYGPMFTGQSIVLSLPSVLFGMILAIGNLSSVKTKYPLAKPQAMFIVLFLISNIVFYISMAASGSTIEQAIDYGWLFQLSEQAQTGKWWSLHDISYGSFADVDWGVAVSAGAIPSLTATIIVLLGQAMRSAGLSELTGVEGNQNHDSMVLGSANVVSGLLGGRVMIFSSASLLNAQLADQKSRVATWMCAVVGFCFLNVGHLLMAYAPKFICGGALFFLGADTLRLTVFANYHKLSTPEFVTLLAVLAVYILANPMYGMGLGIFLTTGIFVAQYVQRSSESVITDIGMGKMYRSTESRSLMQNKVLGAVSGRIIVAKIQGYLFFGNTSVIKERLRDFIGKKKQKDKDNNAKEKGDVFLILNMHRVVGCDTTAINLLLKFTRQLKVKYNIHTICAGVNPTLYRQFNQNGLIKELPQCARQDDTVLDSETGHDAESSSFFGFKRWQLTELEKRFCIFDDGTGRIELSDSDLLSTVLSEFGINASVQQVNLMDKRLRRCYAKKSLGDARIVWITIFFQVVTATITDTERDIMYEVRNTLRYVDSAFGEADNALQWVENQLLSGNRGYIRKREQQSVMVLLENSHKVMAEGGSRRHLKLTATKVMVGTKVVSAMKPVGGGEKDPLDLTKGKEAAKKFEQYDLFTQVVTSMVMEMELADRMVNGSVKEAIDSLRERVAIETLSAGDRVFQTGQTVQRIVIVLKGSLCVTKMLQQKRTSAPYRRMVRERVLVEGSVLGYTHYYYKRRPLARWNAHAVASDTVIASLKFRDLDSIHRDHSRLAAFAHFMFCGDACRDATERLTKYNAEMETQKPKHASIKRTASQKARHRRKNSAAGGV